MLTCPALPTQLTHPTPLLWSLFSLWSLPFFWFPCLPTVWCWLSSRPAATLCDQRSHREWRPDGRRASAVTAGHSAFVSESNRNLIRIDSAFVPN